MSSRQKKQTGTTTQATAKATAKVIKTTKLKGKKNNTGPKIVNPAIDKGIDGSNFRLEHSIIASRAKAIEREYHAHLNKALHDIKLIISEVSKKTGYLYKDVEDDIMATNMARKGTRSTCGWNMYCADRLAVRNKGA